MYVMGKTQSSQLVKLKICFEKSVRKLSTNLQKFRNTFYHPQK